MSASTDFENAYLTYEGPFNIQMISGFARFLSELTLAPHHVRKKLYRVFIELTQNVALYSYERVILANQTNIGKGKVLITEQDNDFKCITINRIQREHLEILKKNCTEINATPLDLLRIKKRELYRLSSFHDTGAHIGLIMIFLYSENPLDISMIEEDNDKLYFKIAATINKN